MFRRILIANRGEIACRVMRTARAMGVECVAVYSDADAGAMHVAMADMAVRIGGAAPAESYLRGDLILRAGLDCGAQAIHPGYGFLSENADFAQAVVDAGLVFIGPSAKAIRAMGLKDRAKELMAAAGVPVVPGYGGADQTPARLAEEAAKIGYPVVIKAVAGGGGKGMRRVDGPADFLDALAGARSEAEAAFGNGNVLLEKWITRPRHIEVQIFGDGAQAVHLFERDCSLQRRHQKVIEEAPAPGMTSDLRAEIGAAAVRAAQAIGYAGAGTVEFIVDSSEGLRADRFWFMEMNTRLQVEHPVTEAVTGIDLVAWQLRVAAGEPLPKSQADLSITGHSFEARIYAEDAQAGFLPATGRLDHLAFPSDARADSGVRAGDAITPYYDPMIAKLVVHGADRAQALSRLENALAGCEVAGTTTNIGFLRRLAAEPDFVAGKMDTGLIERNLDRLVAPQDTPDWIVALAATAQAQDTPFAGFTLWAPLTRQISLGFAGTTYDLLVTRQSRDQYCVIGDGLEVTLKRFADGVEVGGIRHLARVHLGIGAITIFARGAFAFEVPDPLQRGPQVGVGGDAVLAPMPGLVKDVGRKPGETVAQGDLLVVMEAMKMEHRMTAPRAGVIAEIRVRPGDQVKSGAALVLLAEDV